MFEFLADDSGAGAITAFVSGLVMSICSLIGLFKHKEIANFFLTRKKLKLERKKSELEGIQAGRIQQNYSRFLKLKNVTPEQALEALRITDQSIAEVTKKIEQLQQQTDKDKNQQQ